MESSEIAAGVEMEEEMWSWSDVENNDEVSSMECSNSEPVGGGSTGEKKDVDFAMMEVEGTQDVKLRTDVVEDRLVDLDTEQQVQEMVDSWGIVKKDQYEQERGTGFWQEPFAQNVLDFVQRNYMTSKCAALLLGVGVDALRYRRKAFGELVVTVKSPPVLAQKMVDAWGIVKRDEFKVTGRSSTMFWKEQFAKNVLCAVHRNYISKKGGALLLGMNLETLSDKYCRIFGEKEKVPLVMEEIELDDDDDEWWSKLGPDELRRQEDLVNPVNRRTEQWLAFLQFSQAKTRHGKGFVPKKVNFNPYQATLQEVAEFFQLQQLTKCWNENNRPADCLVSLATYLPELAMKSVPELMQGNQPTLKLEDFKFSGKLKPFSPFGATWSSFEKFIKKLGVKNQMDPFLATPAMVREFLNSKFQGDEKRVIGQKESLFRPAYSFYSENLSRICTELDWHLKFSWMAGPVKDSKEMEELVRTAFSCDERILSDALANKLSPDYTYSKIRMNYSEDHFWGKEFTKNVLMDVKSNVLNVSVAASGLGVTAEMIYFSVQKEVLDQENGNISEREYVSVGFGSKSQFWKEQSVMAMLEDVRNRNITAEELAAQLGVSRKEVLSRCGGVKEEAELEAEKTISRLEKVKEKAEKDLNGNKKPTQLEIQIKMAEQNLKNLSDYEKRRLENMKERQALLLSLDFDKEKRELRALTPKIQPREVQVVNLREKSARVKRRSEVEQLRKKTPDSEEVSSKIFWLQNQENRASPQWFGQWVPRVNKNPLITRKSISDQHLYDFCDEVAISRSNHIPKFELPAPQLLEITSNYHKSRILLDSFSAESKQTPDPEQELAADIIQDRQPGKNDQVEIFSEEQKEWYKVRLTTNMIKRHPFYYNCIFPDNSEGGVYLRPGEMWSLRPEQQDKVAAEQKSRTSVDWTKFELIQDSIVSTSELTSLDSYGDFLCYGTKCGGVGVSLASRSLTLRPHNCPVTRTVFIGSKSSLKILSAGLDGTVRMTDLAQQKVSLEYSWDQSWSGKQGIRWMERRGVFSFLLDCGVEIIQIDVRSKEAFQLIQLTAEQPMPGSFTNLSVHPMNKNLISLCRGQSAQIWDLRKASQPVHTLTSPSASHMAAASWSEVGSYLVTCEVREGMEVPVIYPGLDFSKPLLTWVGPRQATFSPFTGVSWCPWQESLFLTTCEQPMVNLRGGLKLEAKQAVVAIDCKSGKVVGELSTGLENPTYLIHCNKTCQMVAVGNSKGPGGLAVFKVT